MKKIPPQPLEPIPLPVPVLPKAFEGITIRVGRRRYRPVVKPPEPEKR